MRAEEIYLIAERLNTIGDELEESEHAFQWESEHLNCWLDEKKDEIHSEWERECRTRRDECESASKDVDRKKREAHNAFDRRYDEIEASRDREIEKIVSMIFSIKKRAQKVPKKLLKRYPVHSILSSKTNCAIEELSSEEFDALLEKLALGKLAAGEIDALFIRSFFDGTEDLCDDVMVDHAGEPLRAAKANLEEIDSLLEKLHDETFSATLKRVFHLFGYCPRKEMACGIQKKIDEGILFEKQCIEEERAKAEEAEESERTKLWAEIGHLDEMRVEAEERSKAGIARATGVKSQKTEGFEATAAKKRKAASNALDNAKERYAQQLRDLDLPFLNAEEEKRRVQLSVNEEQWNEPFIFPEKPSELFPIGVVGRDVRFSGDRLRELNRLSDGMVAQDGILRGVACRSFEDHSPIWVEYFDSEETVMAGVRFMLAAKLKLLPFGALRILFCDAKSRGVNLGRLNRFVNDQRGKVAIEVCATNSQEVESCLSSENRDMGKIGQRLAPYSNVSEFNKNVKERDRIPYTVIVVNDIDDEFFPEQGVMNLRSMLGSAAKFGYDIVVTSHTLENVEDRRKREQIEKLRDNFCVVREQGRGSFVLEEGDSFEFFSDEIVTDTFLSSFAERFLEERKKREDATVEVDISRFIDDDGRSAFGRKHLSCVDAKSGQLGDLSIPYGIDDQENVAVFSLGHNPNYSALVTGSVGSGKSVFLHSLINNIAANCYPSEIELWLVDFKGVEFERYVSQPLPHISIIGLTEDGDFTNSLLEKIEDEFKNKRTRLLMDAGVKKIDEYNALEKKPGYCSAYPKGCPDYLKHVVLIVDEFGVMSAKLEHGQKAEFGEALRKYRSHGLYCVFANQSSIVGNRELLDSDALAQIGGRLAFRNSDDGEARRIFPNDDRLLALPRLHSLIQGQAVIYSEQQFNVVESVFVDQQHEKKIAEECRKSFGESHPLVVDQCERKKFDMGLFSEADMPDAGNCEHLVIGSSMSLLRPYHSIAMRREPYNNVLALGSNSDLRFSAVASLAAAVALSGGVVQIVSAPDSTVYGRYRDFAEALNLDFYDNYIGVRQAVEAAAQAVKNGSTFATHLLVLDEATMLFEEMFSDPEESFGVPSPEEKTADTPENEQELSASDIFKKQLAVARVGQGSSDALQEKQKFIETMMRVVSRGSRQGVHICWSDEFEPNFGSRTLFGMNWPGDSASQVFKHRIASKMKDRAAAVRLGFGDSITDIPSKEENAVMAYCDGLGNCSKFRPFLMGW